MTGRTVKVLGLIVLMVVLAAMGCSRNRPPETETRPRSEAPTDTGTTGTDPGAEDAEAMARDAAMGEISEMIFFDFNQSDLKPEARETLQGKAEAMRQFAEIRVRIEGHADERGTVEYNLALGERRAEAARQYLIDLGIDTDRLTTISYGEERPMVAESNESAWSQNRRDEFISIGG